MEVLDNDINEESNSPGQEEVRPWGMDLNAFCMLMHLSQFAGAIVPLAGFIMPIVMWSTQKEKSEVIDAHGKNIVNFMLSISLYSVICLILSLIIIGIFGFIVLGIASLVFIIIGSVRANDGIIYEYPLTIKFFK